MTCQTDGQLESRKRFSSRYPISFVQSDPSNTRCETTNPTVRDEKGGKDTMEVPTKHIISSYEDDSLSDTSSPEEEKTIPFLR
jgi:hypothetical protein